MKSKKQKSTITFGTAAWKIKFVRTSPDLFVKLASISVVCGFSGCFEKLNVNFNELLSNATIDGYARPFPSVTEQRKTYQL